jgi:23S rRNA (guanosine2251-2'-O)-methyltransferase
MAFIMSSRFKVQSSKFKNPKSKVQSPKSKVYKDRKPKTENRRPKNSALSTQHSALLYGVLPVTEALRAGNRRIEKILIAEGAREKRLSEIWNLARQNGVQIQKTPRENLSKYTEEGTNHQGVVALVAAADYADADKLLTEIAAKENSLTLILDGVEDPRNLGAILRAAECAGADGAFIPEHRAAGLTETVVKTSAGATEYLKIAKVKNLNRLIEELKSHNIWVVGTSAEAEMDYTDWDWTQSSALVLGSEGKGLHRLVAENCDALVKIPMRGKIESLNVSVACGVILFEANRQRSLKNCELRITNYE